MSQDDPLFRKLLRPSTPLSPSLQARYAKGLFTSYLQRAEDAAASARAYALRANGTRETASRFARIAAENLFKAIRVAHGLSATRSTSLRELLDGREKAAPLPAQSAWRERLARIAELLEAPSERALEAVTRLEAAIRDASALSPPRRSSSKPRATPRPRRSEE